MIPMYVAALPPLLLSSVSACAGSILLSDTDFTVLGGTAITSTGVVGTAIVHGDVGLAPGATTGITGFPPAEVIGGGAMVAARGPHGWKFDRVLPSGIASATP
jgi:hypothetical protein